MQKKISYIIILLLVFNVGLKAQSNKIDSLVEVVEKITVDTSKINAWNDIVWKIKRSDYKKATEIGLKSLKLSEKISFYKGTAYASKNLGAVYYYQSDYGNALKSYEKSLSFFEKIKDKKGIAIAYRNIGNIYHQQGNFKPALEYFFKSLALREEIGDRKGISAVYGAIGLVYSQSGDDEIKSALEYYKKSLKIQTELDDKLGMAASYLYIGSIYSDLQTSTQDSTNSKLAKEYFEKCNIKSKEINNLGLIAMSDNALGNIYLNTDEPEKAFEHYQNGLKIFEQLNSSFNIANSYVNIGSYHIHKEKFKTAEKELLKAYQISEQIGATAIKKNASGELAKVYSKMKKFEKANNYLIKFYSLKDTLQNEENTKKMTQLSMQYEFDKTQKLQEIEQQKKDEIQEANNRRQKIIIYSVIIGLILMTIFAGFIFKSYKDKQKVNKKLADMNIEILSKNAMLNQQNEEIEAQRDEIEKQRDFVIEQRDKIAHQNKHITDSIVYAQRIQQAVMPPQEFFDNILAEYFILFKPRDIVSGDYYWATQKGDKVIIAAADCTGHGVPGAFMSLLGISFLNEIVNKIEFKEIEANLILNNLRASVKNSLKQTGKFGEAKDGMDMALCVIDTKKNTLQYSGANNPLYVIRNEELITYKADKMPVGIFYKEKESFTNNDIQLEKGDTFYIFSDGYIDQFGGEKGRKFMSKRFKRMLLENHKSHMSDQKEFYNKTIEDWKANKDSDGEHYEQVDDILVIGFRM